MRWLAGALLAVCAAAGAEPWIVYGQSALAPWTLNPAPNDAGLIGEVDALPYQVPAGRVLVIRAYGIENHYRLFLPRAGFHPTLVLVPVVSDSPVLDPSRAPEINRQALPSCVSATDTNICRITAHVPAGKWIHVLILNPDAVETIQGWHVEGDLVDAGQMLAAPHCL